MCEATHMAETRLPNGEFKLALYIPRECGHRIHHHLRRAYLKVGDAANRRGARGPYDLRHTAAMLLIEAGVPVKTVSKRLGHASVGITLSVYVHPTPAQHDQATAVLGALVE